MLIHKLIEGGRGRAVACTARWFDKWVTRAEWKNQVRPVDRRQKEQARPFIPAPRAG